MTADQVRKPSPIQVIASGCAAPPLIGFSRSRFGRRHHILCTSPILWRRQSLCCRAPILFTSRQDGPSDSDHLVSQGDRRDFVRLTLYEFCGPTERGVFAVRAKRRTACAPTTSNLRIYPSPFLAEAVFSSARILSRYRLPRALSS